MMSLWDMIESSVTVFESFTIIYFVCEMNGFHPLEKGNKKAFVTGSLVLSAISLILFELLGYEGLWGLLYVVYYFVFGIVITRSSVGKSLFSAVSAELIIVCVSALVSNLISTVAGIEVSDVYYSENVMRVIFLLIAQTLHIYFFMLFIKWFGKKSKQLGVGEWLLSASTLILSFVVMILIQLAVNNAELSANSKLYFLTAELAVVIMNIVILFITDALSRSNAEKNELLLLREQEMYRSRYAEDVKEQYNEVRRIRHDMKQNLAAISALCSDGKYDKAEEYANSCADRLEKMSRIIDVENEFANAILNSKTALAGEKGIKVICHCTPFVFEIDNEDICSLFGNILDNAIEAAEQCGEDKRYIEISVRAREERMSVKVSNSIPASVLTEGRFPTTSKKDKEHHGFGVSAIRSIAEKYGGNVHYSEEGAYLCCRVDLFRR